jgi:peptidyl-prolyl cis-trans isomerase D
MITLFRNFARSKFAIALLVLVGIAVLVGGAKMDIFGGLGAKHIITAGSRTMDSAEFRTTFDRLRTNAAERAGRPVTMADLVAENLHTRFLDEQTRQLGFLNWAWKAGIRPGKSLVIKQIREIPVFFNAVSGKFDEDMYKSKLAENGYTPQRLEQEFRDQYAVNHFGAAAFAGMRLPRVYGAVLAGRALETRDGRWFEVTQAMAGTTAAPTDAQLTAFISENAAQLRRPEFRMASVLLFDNPTDTAADIPEARIVERFNFKKDTLSTPETRTFVTLTAPNKAAADRIAAALRAGQTPAQAGQANGGLRPTPFSATPRTAVTDPAVAAAVFGAVAGQVTDPVQGRVGFTVAQITAITPGAPATLDSARAAVVAELKDEDAKAAVFSRVEKYEKARSDGKTLQQAATEIGGRFVQLPPFTQDGKLPDGQPMNAPPQILQSAYSLSKGGESDVIDAGQGQYFVLRLNDIRPAALPTLAEVRAPLAEQWVLRENAKRLAAKAEELASRVRSGQDIAAVAASAGGTLVTRTSVQQNPQAQTEIGQGVLQGLFGQGKGQVFSGPASQTAYVVGRVDNIHGASPVLAAPIAEQVRVRMTQQMGNDMVEAALAAGALRSKAKNDPALALEALGLDASATTPGSTPTPTPAQ